ncbi:amino acid adenylation domain-containing protein [Streptomyces vinaceus]|uniref:non-ribosomal peptide synthetase n=1 Tax=Streptomyces vinaceus TaxID=1960 RepID=UPI003674B56E
MTSFRTPLSRSGRLGPGTPHCSETVRQDAPAAPRDLTLAAFAATLYRHSGHSRIEFEAVRGGSPESLRFVVDGERGLSALAAGAVPLRDVSSPARVGVHFGGLEDIETAGARASYELQLVVGGGADHCGIGTAALRYDPRLFDEAAAAQLLAHYANLLRDGLDRPDRPLSELSLLSPTELHHILVEWNDTGLALPYEGALLHTPFEAVAARSPDAVAVVQGATRLTYGQVDAAANRLAHHLIRMGVGPDARVGLYLEHSPDLLVAMLGVLKAGGAYVPLDPGYPLARLQSMITGAACVALVSQSDIADRLFAQEPGRTGQLPRVVLLDRAAEVLAAEPCEAPRPQAGPHNLCYVIHTSGSTGSPKAIALRHSGVVNNIADLNTRFTIGPGDSVMGLSSPSFDMSVYEYLGITAAGGTVVLPHAGRAKEPGHWAELAATHGTTVWNTAPALLQLVLEHAGRSAEGGAPRPSPLGNLRLIMLAGDWIPLNLPERAREAAPAARFISLGGATEASIYSTIFEVDEVDPAWTSIPYGRPMANQRTYILDDARRPVPPGVTGELYLAGAGLAVGYLGQPELTAERFIEWSCGALVRERLYRTGDLARFGPDGLIELIGRVDLQVKIHGLRVELTEIESVLREHPAVKDAAVTVESDAAGSPALVGYVVAQRGEDPAHGDIRRHLMAKLPVHMLPGAVHLLPAMPLTPNGKLDRKALASEAGAPSGARPARTAPARTTPARTTPAAARPDGSWEKRIAVTWCDVLGLDEVSGDDDFFALGGDSMRALRCMTAIPDITLADLYRFPTLRALAAHLAATIADDTTEPEKGNP